MDSGKWIFGKTPPPRKDDVLFRAAESGTNACISHWHNVNSPYKNGFRLAALRLALQVCETRTDQDSLVYPILYLYRHHLELVLKDIFKSLTRLLDRPVMKEEDYHLGRHDLIPIWEMIVPLLDPVCELAGERAIPTEDVEGVRAYLFQVAEHDPDGQRFRYATVRESLPKKSKLPRRQVRSIKEELQLVNIRVFAKHVEQLADYLQGLGGWVDDLLGMKIDMESER